MKWLQKRLHHHGFNPGVIDGIWGRNTRNALIEFQRDNGLRADGITNNPTIRALRAAHPEPAPPKHLLEAFPWMELALRKKGLHENDDNRDLKKFLHSDPKNKYQLDPAVTPWCGDFVETCIGLTLPTAILPSNPYGARNWCKFGRTVDPCFGSILVFWRVSINSWKGHVGFYYSEDDTNYQVLGGNQNNQVCIASYRKDRLLSAQLPDVGEEYPRHIIRGADDFAKKVDMDLD